MALVQISYPIDNLQRLSNRHSESVQPTGKDFDTLAFDNTKILGCNCCCLVYNNMELLLLMVVGLLAQQLKWVDLHGIQKFDRRNYRPRFRLLYKAVA